MGNYVYFVFSYWLLLIGIYLFGFGRLYFQILPVGVNYVVDEKVYWNAKINPYKIKVYFGLFAVLTFFSFLSQEDVIINLLRYNFAELYRNFIGLLGIISTLFFIETKVKSKTKSYTKNLKDEIISIEVFKELKPSTLNADDIKKQFDFALNENYFDCEFSQFENLLKLNSPVEKIIWKPISDRKKMKKRQLLLTYLNELFQKQLIKVDRKDICKLVNIYFEFNETNHKTIENPLTPDNVGDWITKV